MPRTLIAAAAALAAALPAPSALAADAAPAPTSTDAACPGADAVPTPRTAAAAADAVLCLIDEERATRDLPRLRDEMHLGTAAQRRARDLTRAGGSPASSAASAQRRISGAGYAAGRPFAFGEILGHGAARTATPSSRVRAWLRSAATRRLLLSPTFRDAGAAVRVVHRRTLFVLELAAPGRGSRR